MNLTNWHGIPMPHSRSGLHPFVMLLCCVRIFAASSTAYNFTHNTPAAGNRHSDVRLIDSHFVYVFECFLRICILFCSICILFSVRFLMCNFNGLVYPFCFTACLMIAGIHKLFWHLNWIQCWASMCFAIKEKTNAFPQHKKKMFFDKSKRIQIFLMFSIRANVGRNQHSPSWTRRQHSIWERKRARDGRGWEFFPSRKYSNKF